MKEVIEETDTLTVHNFLEDPADFLLAECQPDEVESRLMNLLAWIKKSKSIAKVDISHPLHEMGTELVD